MPAHVVHAAFYSFAEGEAARHIPSAWETIPPEASIAARERGSPASLRRILGDELADSPGLTRAADLTTKAATSALTAGRVMYAGMRTLPVPSDPVARLWHSATMLREHRCDGHVAALVGARIGGTEAHVLSALDMGIHPPESFGRIHHLPKKRLAEVMDGLRERGLVDADSCFTDAGRETKQRIEALTGELAAPSYDALSPAELDEQEAVAIANDSEFGLGGSVWTSVPERGASFARKVRTGTIGVNGYVNDPSAPFGGVRPAGMGRELGPKASSPSSCSRPSTWTRPTTPPDLASS